MNYDNLRSNIRRSYKDLPDFTKYGKVTLMRDADIKVPVRNDWSGRHTTRQESPYISGCYLWYENQHFSNRLLYVGISTDILSRLYQEGRVDSGFIDQHIEKRLSDSFEPCRDYDSKCDCIPRHFVVLIETDNYINLEKYLIDKLSPPLNKRIYKLPNEQSQWLAP